LNELWSSAVRRLSSKITPQNFDLWVGPIRCGGIEGTVLHLQAPNPYVKLWFESNYLDSILTELEAETGTSYQVEFEVLESDNNGANGQVPTPPMSGRPDSGANGSAANTDNAFVEEAIGTQTPQPKIAVDADDGDVHVTKREAEHNDSPSDPLLDNSIINVALNPRYNFDTFVSGPSNQLAFAAAQSCANSYPPKYNPVFVCGGVGLGKTHLLHAIGHQIIKHRPNSKLCYISGERFMNEYVHAIRTNQMHTFRSRYRENVDVLLVDDVQFLAGKGGTQDEFFHTFNALHDSHRQIVLTADRKPHEISDIADRLRSRFAWGLLADIEPPELEVRMAILSEKAQAENIHLPDAVSMYIANSIKSNVRELEGALIRLAAYASLSRREITLEFARETLEGSITRPPEHLSVDAILKSVASYYTLKVSDLKSPRRHKSIAGPRAIAMYLARVHTKESYPDLGRAFGGKHHTTVISAVEKITKRLPSDDSLRGEIAAIENTLLR
jgi:chromosomal replication initiator protein